MGSKIPEEKRHYSVDEMMDRLKGAKSTKDGRGRKRRRTKQAKQPHLEPNQRFQRTLVKITIGLAVLVAIVAVVLFAVSKLNEFRYGGAKFSEAVANRLSEISGLSVGLGKLEVDGRLIAMREGLISGSDNRFLRRAQIKGFKGAFEMRSFFGGEWYLDKFEVFELNAVVGRPENGASSEVAGASGVDEPTGGGFGLSSRPNAVLPEVVRLRDVDIFWDEEDGASSLKGVDVVAEVFSGEMSIHASGGKLVLAGFPEWNLMNLNAKLDGGVLDIDQSRYLVDKRDELKISGKIDTRPDGGMELKGALENLLLSRLLPDYWRGKLDGRLGSDFTFSMEFGEGAEPVFGGSFEIRDFVLRGLPVFDTLAIYAGEHGLGFMEIPSVKGKFRRVGGVLTISDFESLKAGLLKMRGEITITDGQVGGVIEVGLPDAIFDKLAGGRPDLFKVEGSGFAWAMMNLSGGVDSPVEDLSPKLMELIRKQSEARGRVTNPTPTAPGAVDRAGKVLPEKVLPEKVGSELPASDDERKKKIENAFENLINGQ